MKKFTNKKLYLSSSIAFFVSAFLVLVGASIKYFTYFDSNYLLGDLISFLPYLALVVLGIILIIKRKNGIFVPIILGCFLLCHFVSFIGNLISFLDYVVYFMDSTVGSEEFFVELDLTFSNYTTSLSVSFLTIACVVFALIMSILSLNNKKLSNKLAIIPLVIFALSFSSKITWALTWFIEGMYSGALDIAISSFTLLFFGAGITLLTFAILTNESEETARQEQSGLEEESVSIDEFDTLQQQRAEKDELYKIKEIQLDLVVHILLLLFTSPIWDCVWIYKTTRILGEVEGKEKRSPICQMLLCLFVPFYVIYWLYKTCKLVETLSNKVNVNGGDVMLLSILFQFIFPVASYIVIQEKLNQICNAIDVKYTTPYNEEQEEKTFTNVNEETSSDDVTILRNYKELLDDGVITQEEFDKKKKEILHL